jgi:hypothetical protein
MNALDMIWSLGERPEPCGANTNEKAVRYSSAVKLTTSGSDKDTTLRIDKLPISYATVEYLFNTFIEVT